MNERRTGRSTKQIKECPPGAFYICPNWFTVPYYEGVARQVNRIDVVFCGSVRAEMRLAYRFIEIDHAAYLTPQQTAEINTINHLYTERMCK